MDFGGEVNTSLFFYGRNPPKINNLSKEGKVYKPLIYSYLNDFNGGELMTVAEASRETIPLTRSFISYINNNCIVDEIEGGLVCKKCGSMVIIDFFEKTLECTGCDEL